MSIYVNGQNRAAFISYNFQGINLGFIQRAKLLLNNYFTTQFSTGAAPQMPLYGGVSQAIAGLIAPPPGYGPAAINQAISLLAQFFSFGISQNPYSFAQSPYSEIGPAKPAQTSQIASLFNALFVFQFKFTPVSMKKFIKKEKVSGKDKFAISSCRGGKLSNLNNSDHLKLAIWDLMKRKKVRNFNKLAKLLKSEYGIEAKVTTVQGRKALKFSNGAMIVDGNGNGALDMSDYNFKGAIKDIEKRWGMKADQILSKAKELTKSGLSFEEAIDYLKSGGTNFSALPQLQAIGISGNFLSALQQFNAFSFAQRPFFPIQQISMMFLSAWLLASP